LFQADQKASISQLISSLRGWDETRRAQATLAMARVEGLLTPLFIIRLNKPYRI